MHKANAIFMSFRYTYLLLFVCLSTWCYSQSESPLSLEWPDLTQETKPWSRWWWHGNSVTKQGITAELEAYQKAGLGGLELTPIYGVIGEEEQFIDYLSEEWLDLFQHTLREAKRLGLGLDMATGTGWPFGGPWVEAKDACKYLEYKTYELKAGERLADPVVFMQEPFVRAVTNQVYQLYGIYREEGEPVTGSMSRPELLSNQKNVEVEDLIEPVAGNENLQALALDQVRFEKTLPLQSLMAYSNKGELVDLTEKVKSNGHLDWTAPSGKWTLYALFQGWHGKMVERAAPGGEGNVIDHFSTTAIQNYLKRFDAAFAEKELQGLRAFFNDSYEVDDARGQSNWTPLFLEAFQKKRGYDLRSQLPALFGDDKKERNARVLSDFRETYADLLLETFTKEWNDWAHNHDAITRNQAHGSPANILDLYAASDIPETEGTDMIRIKFASSAAHVTGKKLTSSESATWLDEHFLSNLSNIKENLDRYLVGGVNHVLYHGTCYSPPEDEWPGRLFYAAIHANPRNSLWHDFPALNQYIARSQSFLQTGKPHNDILLYFPIYDRFATPGAELLEHFDGYGPNLEGTHFEESANFLQEQGYAFDFISDRQINNLMVEEKALTTGGVSYQTVVLPQCQYIPLATFEKLVSLAKEGASVIIHQSLPQSVPGLGNLTERQATFEELLDQLNFARAAKGVKEAKIGSGVVLLGGKMDRLLDYAGIGRESLVDQGLEYIRRSNEDGNCYFITNWSDQKVEEWIPLQKAAASVALFDPMTGKSGVAQTRKSASGGTEVYLQIAEGASYLLQSYLTIKESTTWPYYQEIGTPVPLVGSWKVEFTKGGPGQPAPIQLDALKSWTELGAEEYTHFSGTARYTLQFPKPEGSGDGWVLDLGAVHESAQVRLNGRLLSTLIGPAYQITVGQELFQENNTLEIEVSNLMANRIIGLEKNDVFWKKFYNVNFPARRSENRNENGLFDASNWSPLPSGLLGPVTLTRMEKLD